MSSGIYEAGRAREREKRTKVGKKVQLGKTMENGKRAQEKDKKNIWLIRKNHP